jgi:hypothetical protein
VSHHIVLVAVADKAIVFYYILLRAEPPKIENVLLIFNVPLLRDY